jgi:hypothetical protein
MMTKMLEKIKDGFWPVALKKERRDVVKKPMNTLSFPLTLSLSLPRRHQFLHLDAPYVFLVLSLTQILLFFLTVHQISECLIIMVNLVGFSGGLKFSWI